ncbi:MAG: zeta toxin family protein [Vicinamibacterales bacterium]
MAVARLPVIPDSYAPPGRTAAEALVYWKAIETGRQRWESVWRGRIARVVADEYRRRIIPAIRRGSSVGHATVLAEQAIYSNRDAWEDLFYELYGQVCQDFAARTARGLKAAAALEHKADPEVEAALGDEGLEDRWLTVVAEWLEKSAGARIRHIQATTLTEVRRTLADGARKGLGIPAIARALEQATPEISYRRGVTIARTEVISASNLGSRAGAIDTGLALDHEWIATPGARTRPWHFAASGQIQPLNEPFIVKGERLMFPGDSSLGASASNLVMCRCTEAYAPAQSGGYDPEAGVDTLSHYRVDGQLDPERQALHDRIVADMLRGIPEREQPTAYMMGGGPASGKSTMIDTGAVTLPSKTTAVHIDPDYIKSRLPEYQAMTRVGNTHAAALSHAESSFIAKRVLAEGGQRRIDLVIDGTGDGGIDTLTAKVNAIRATGHRVIANYASNSVDLALKLAYNRGVKTGRFVPETLIRQIHAGVSTDFPRAIERGLFDAVTLYDTNIKGQARLVASQTDGVFRVHNEGLWEDFVRKAEGKAVALAPAARTPIDPAILVAVTAEIVRGVALEASAHRDVPGIADVWPDLAADVAAIHGRGAVVDIPDEWFG